MLSRNLNGVYMFDTKIKVNLSVSEIVNEAGGFEDSLGPLGLSENLNLATEDGTVLPCYFDILQSSQSITSIDQARIAVCAAMCAGAAEEAVIMVSSNSEEPAHKFWLELAKEVDALVNTIQRKNTAGSKRLVYTILFSATPYVATETKALVAKPAAKKPAPASVITAASKKTKTSKWVE